MPVSINNNSRSYLNKSGRLYVGSNNFIHILVYPKHFTILYGNQTKFDFLTIKFSQTKSDENKKKFKQQARNNI